MTTCLQEIIVEHAFIIAIADDSYPSSAVAVVIRTERRLSVAD